MNTTASALPSMALPPSGIRKNIIRCFEANLVPVVTSSPGLGKTEIMGQIAHDYRLKLIDFRFGQADITDLNGLPKFREDGRAEFVPFDNFPLEGDELPDHPDGGKYDGWLLFLDEITSAPKQIQAAGYKLLLERMVGNHRLHPRVKMAGAGNLLTDKAVVHAMSTAQQSRLIHLEMRVDHKEWMLWAHSNNIDTRIVGFLEFKTDALHRFDPDHEDKTFACPRTWKFVDNLIRDQEVTSEDTPLLAGTVSTGIAMEFVQFCQIYLNLPKIHDIVKDPEHCKIPTEASTKYALVTVLAESMTEKNAQELLTYLHRFPIELQVVCLRMVRIRNNKLIRNPHVIQMLVDWNMLAQAA